ncbi:MAG: phenylalanine--tRNA ligase subunit beta [Holophaga sp.]|nr:phenylalanine--tRNA ligase subunit beta [Holophaga sp.]
MLIEINALTNELPALAGKDTVELCELLAGLGFPVDGVETQGDTTVLEVDVTANRGDAQSHRGLARDLAAKLGAELGPLDRVTLHEGEPLVPIRLEAGDAAPFYSTAVLELGKAGSTPLAVRSFLAAMGAGAKGLPAVDASNELLHRYGHPTHAFDADKVKGGITVRFARPGEKMVTLDGVERTLTPQDLLITDDSGPIGMAGTMGGDSTKVSARTKRVLLESAYFDAGTVRAMAHRHGLHTDASIRYGRGADPGFARVARDLLAQRLQAWCGARLQSAWSVGSLPPSAAWIALPWAMMDRVAGYAIERGSAVAYLRRLGCEVQECADGLSVQPPTWRHDLSLPDDLTEEVLRLAGYEAIPAVLPPLDSAPVALAADYLKRRKLAARLANLGFFQTVTLGFTNAQEERDGAGCGDHPELRTLRNPLGEDYSVMRGTLLRDLARIARMNLERGAKEARFFEIAPVFEAHPGQPMTETWTLGLVWGGEVGGEDPLSPARRIGEPEGQSHLIGVLKSIGVSDAAIHSFKRWKIPNWEGGGKEQPGWQFEIPLDGIPDEAERIIPPFVPFSRFPVVERDLSLLVTLDQPYEALRQGVAAALGAAPLSELKCVDVFRHKNLPAGRQAWLLRMRFQGTDRTLTGEEVDGWMARALAAAKSLGAELRS